MKLSQTTAVICAALILSLSWGCKKSEPAKTYAVTSLIDSVAGTNIGFQYNNDNRLSAITSPYGQYDFTYANSRVAVRKYTDATNGLTNIDSFRYDANGRLSSVIGCDGAAVKTKTTVFVYNGDNTLNTVTVDFVSPAANDLLFEYQYTAGNLAVRNKSEFVSGSYHLSSKSEFLAYDNHANPLASLYRNNLADLTEVYAYFIYGPNNALSIKGTQYDLTTGLPTSVYSGALAFTYNADGIPTRIDYTEGVNNSTIKLTYIEL